MSNQVDKSAYETELLNIMEESPNNLPIIDGSIIKEIKLDKLIGIGGYGHIYYSLINDNEYIIKIQSNEDRMEIIEKEIQMNSILKHKNTSHICEYYGFINADINTYLIFEYVPSCNLYHYMSKNLLQKNSILKVVTSIFKAVKCIHDSGIIHLDIKPENILFDDVSEKITIIDFGLSLEQDTIVTSARGSPSYMSPEMVDTVRYQRVWSVNVTDDVWAIGVITWEMFTGITMFDSASVDNNNNKISSKAQMDIIMTSVSSYNIDRENKKIPLLIRKFLLTHIFVPAKHRISCREAIIHLLLIRLGL